MKNTILIILILTTTQLIAQDRILTTKSDTLTVKINSIDKQKVVYTDAQQKQSEIPINALHKIIWRSGLEYVINQEIEENLKTEQKLNITKPKNIKEESKPTINEKEELTTKYEKEVYPELKVHSFGLFRFYTVDGKRVRRNQMESTIYKYDLEDAQEFLRGNGLKQKGMKMGYTAWGINIGLAFVPISMVTIVMSTGCLVVMTIGVVKDIKGNMIMKRAVKAYEQKRLSNTIKPRFTHNNINTKL